MPKYKRTHYHSAWLLIAIALVVVLIFLTLHEKSERNRKMLQRYLRVLPSISLEMVKVQSALEASDGRVLAPGQVIKLKESLTHLLAKQSAGFNQQNLAMKIEILRRENTLDHKLEQELHRFGSDSCEPTVQLKNQIEQVHFVDVIESGNLPQYQVTLCYKHKDGVFENNSASSLDLALNDAMLP